MASLVVPCPKCATKLSAPDSAVGKQIRCPKCGALATVPNLLPAEVVPVVEATVSPPRPKPKPKPVQAEVADDDDEDDRPRKKKQRDEEEADDDRPRKKKRRGSGSGTALVVGGLVLFATLATGAILLARKGSPPAGGTGTDSPLEDMARKTLGPDAPPERRESPLPTDPPAPVPAGWQFYSYPDDRFRAYFPIKPIVGTKQVSAVLQGDGGPAPPKVVQAAYTEVSYTAVGGPPESIFVKVTMVRHPEGVPTQFRATHAAVIAKLREGGPNPVGGRAVRWLGCDAVEAVQANVLRRALIRDDRTVLMVEITGRDGRRAPRDVEAGFFSNFELTK